MTHPPQTRPQLLAHFDDDALYIAKRQYIQPGDVDLAGVFDRVATGVASIEALEHREMFKTKFFDLMASKSFCPGGRILAGVGTEHGNALNCFIQVNTEFEKASWEGITELAVKLALSTKVGGGNGINLDGYHRAEPKTYGRLNYALINADHPDVLSMIRQEMVPANDPDGKPVFHRLKNFRVVVVYDHDAQLTEEIKEAIQKAPDLINPIRRNDLKPGAVIEVEDDLECIIRAAMSIDPEGDSYIDFSKLRPSGSPIKGSSGISSGPVSFLIEIFDNIATLMDKGREFAGPVNLLRYCFAPILRVVKQGGVRRGAGMATMSISSPHIRDFITCKDLEREKEEGDISTFNISVLVSDGYMQSIKDGRYPQVEGLFREIAEHAWWTGEPGLLFTDTINNNSAFGHLGPDFQINATNPCGEQPMLGGEACCLGAMNLGMYVTSDGHFYTAKFMSDVRTAVRFLDNVLDINKFAVPDNAESVSKYRRIGLGVMGLADMLIKMGLRYDSPEAYKMVNLVMTKMHNAAIAESYNLGAQRGDYPASLEHKDVYKRRNIAVLTIAPTGTTAMLMGASGGVEPIFSPFIYRRIGSEYRSMLNPLLVDLLSKYEPPVKFHSENGKWDHDKLIEVLNKHHGSLQDIPEIPEEIRDVFVCAHDINPVDHVKMQGALQRAMDTNYKAGTAISKTCNLPNSATVEDVLEIYDLAWQEGCKGVTVYRDGSRQFQVLSVSKEEAVKEEKEEEQEKIEPVLESQIKVNGSFTGEYVRPERLYGYTDRVRASSPGTGERHVYLVTVNGDESPKEVIITSGKGGDESNADSEALGRVVSIALQQGVSKEALIKTLRGINGGLYGTYQGRIVTSKADLVGVALETYQKPNSGAVEDLIDTLAGLGAKDFLPPTALNPEVGGKTCSICKGSSLIKEEGCEKCRQCGWSKCGG